MDRCNKNSMASCIEVDIAKQQLQLFNSTHLVKSYTVATARNGQGELSGSECTPTGKHLIRAKLGDKAIANSVFIARRNTGEIYSSALRQEYPERDWILTRIMWLSGCEVGKNRLYNQDTMRRYIYIHGCPDEDKMGIPSSHGCIKMRNSDIIQLFDLVKIYTPVFIF